MKVTKLTTPFILTDAEGNTRREEVCPGSIHVGEIAHYIWTVGYGKKLGAYGDLDEGSKLRAARGFIFEIGIMEYYKRRGRFEQEDLITQQALQLEEPGGLVIVGTPDAIVYPRDESRPVYTEQWKATAKTIPPTPQVHNAFALWLLSDQAYSFMLSTALGRPCCTCRYVICTFSPANFVEPIQSFEVTWEMPELEQHWETMVRAARELKRNREIEDGAKEH